MGQQTVFGSGESIAGTAADRRIYHVTITVAGPDLPEGEVKQALERLAERHQFLLSGRYASDRAEIRFWDEGSHLRDAAARALLLWSEHAVAGGPAAVGRGRSRSGRPGHLPLPGPRGRLTVPAVGSGDLRPF